jgi:hypothetical protein
MIALSVRISVKSPSDKERWIKALPLRIFRCLQTSLNSPNIKDLIMHYKGTHPYTR